VAARARQFNMSEAELEMYTAFIAPMTADYQVVESMSETKQPVNYARNEGYSPAEKENTLNAWYWKSVINGADNGKLAGKRIVVKDNFDILVMPTTVMKALKIPGPNPSLEEVLSNALPMIGNTAPFDVTGHPSMSPPAGMSDGLPVGIMLTGRISEDDVVLRAGHALEQLLV
jgi:Asp-tRNA(Asn)/Glu-tRNA(Gln) amidotransferase A subunit family amidase